MKFWNIQRFMTEERLALAFLCFAVAVPVIGVVLTVRAYIACPPVTIEYGIGAAQVNVEKLVEERRRNGCRLERVEYRFGKGK